MSMRVISSLFVLLSTLWLAAARADDPVLMVLEHVENHARVQTNVDAKAGQTIAPLHDKALEKIRVLPGNPLAVAQAPANVTVELNRGSGAGAAPVCVITVRYFRDARGLWVPHYQLVEDVLVARGPDGRWKPLSVVRGMPSLIVMTGSALPNPDGFFPYLEFGLTNGMLQIDSWTIR
jgi:hypothetical protein